MNFLSRTTALLVLVGLLFAVLWFSWAMLTAPLRNPGVEGGSSQVLGQTSAVQNRPLSLQYIDAYYSDSQATVDCDYELVAKNKGPYLTENIVEDSVTALLKTDKHPKLSNGLYNPLHKSDLTFIANRVVDDTVKLELVGWLWVDNVCQQQQAIDQIETTVLAATGLKQVEITLNQQPLADSLRY